MRPVSVSWPPMTSGRWAPREAPTAAESLAHLQPVDFAGEVQSGLIVEGTGFLGVGGVHIDSFEEQVLEVGGGQGAGQHALTFFVAGAGEAKEGLGGGGLQHPAREIGHAGGEVAHGRIHTHTQPFLHQCLAQALGHAQQDLPLDGGIRQPGRAAGGQATGHAAGVVTGYDGMHTVGVLNQEPGETLKLGISVGFVEKNGRRPVLSCSQAGLFFPVGALDEADCDGGGPLVGQIHQVQGVLFRIAQVRLYCHSQMRVVAELAFGEQEPDHSQGQVAQPELLHIQDHGRALVAGGAQDGAQACGGDLAGVVKVERVQAGADRRQFQRDRYPRCRSPRRIVGRGVARPVGRFAAEEANGLHVVLLQRLRPPGARRTLAEHIEGDRGLLPVQAAQRAGSVGGGLAGDVGLAHQVQVVFDSPGHQPRGELTRPRRLDAPAENRRQLARGVFEILLNM